MEADLAAIAHNNVHAQPIAAVAPFVSGRALAGSCGRLLASESTKNEGIRLQPGALTGA